MPKPTRAKPKSAPAAAGEKRTPSRSIIIRPQSLLISPRTPRMAPPRIRPANSQGTRVCAALRVSSHRCNASTESAGMHGLAKRARSHMSNNSSKPRATTTVPTARDGNAPGFTRPPGQMLRLASDFAQAPDLEIGAADSFGPPGQRQRPLARKEGWSSLSLASRPWKTATPSATPLRPFRDPPLATLLRPLGPQIPRRNLGATSGPFRTAAPLVPHWGAQGEISHKRRITKSRATNPRDDRGR
jgi:hypothetical protein